MRRLFIFIILLAVALVLTGCWVPVPYAGPRLQTPARHIVVVDTGGNPLNHYDLYVYRCTNPGSSHWQCTVSGLKERLKAKGR